MKDMTKNIRSKRRHDDNNRCHKAKKKVQGWSIEEMKEKPNVAVVEDTEEMRKWSG